MKPQRAPLRTLLSRLAADRRAATAIEYGLIVSLIVIVMVVAFVEVANATTGLWNTVSTQVANAH